MQGLWVGWVGLGVFLRVCTPKFGYFGLKYRYFERKLHFFVIFLPKNLHISKKSITFAPNFKNNPTKTT